MVEEREMRSYMVNVRGDWEKIAKLRGYHAFHYGGVTVITMQAKNKATAKLLVRSWGCEVLFVFE